MSGSCGVSAVGAMGCDWMSAVNLRLKDGTTKGNPADKNPELFTTRYVLTPGAPLDMPKTGQDTLIVVMNAGEVVNERSTSHSQLDVWNGLVMMMPKDEPFLLRNVGKQNLELLLIEVRKRPLAQPL